MAEKDWQSRLKTGRNEPCPCGSGRKYKKCHLAADEKAESEAMTKTAAEAAAKAKTEKKEEDHDHAHDHDHPHDHDHGHGHRRDYGSPMNTNKSSHMAKQINAPRKAGP
jgi:membrane protein involved in colicin uptake